MRLFIAINFSEVTRLALTTLRDDLQKQSKGGNFTLAENIHLTLAFLGECNTKQTADAVTAIDATATLFKPFTIEIERIGRFKRNGGDIWWAGIRENKPLLCLQQDLTNRLIALGFSLETRKYSPHITLGRQVITSMKERTLTPIAETVTKIDLMQSMRVDGKLTYVPIHRKNIQ